MRSASADFLGELCLHWHNIEAAVPKVPVKKNKTLKIKLRCWKLKNSHKKISFAQTYTPTHPHKRTHHKQIPDYILNLLTLWDRRAEVQRGYYCSYSQKSSLVPRVASCPRQNSGLDLSLASHDCPYRSCFNRTAHPGASGSSGHNLLIAPAFRTGGDRSFKAVTPWLSSSSLTSLFGLCRCV